MGFRMLPTATLLLMSASKGSLISEMGDSFRDVTAALRDLYSKAISLPHEVLLAFFVLSVCLFLLKKSLSAQQFLLTENERLWEKVTEYEQKQTEICKDMKDMQRKYEILSMWLNVYTTNSSRKRVPEMKSTRGESRCSKAKGSEILITRIKQHLKI